MSILISTIIGEIEKYQTYLLKSLAKATKNLIELNSLQNSVHLNDCFFKKKEGLPTTIYLNLDKHPRRTKSIVNKYHASQECKEILEILEILNYSINNGLINLFLETLKKKMPLLTKHRNHPKTRFLQVIGVFLCTLAILPGLLYFLAWAVKSKIQTESFQFWKTRGERMADKVQEEFKMLHVV